MAIKRCPHCGSNILLAKVVRGAQVESLEDGTFKILNETNKTQIEVVTCNSCKANVTEADLVDTLIPCKSCGALTLPGNLDENGECDVCKATKVRPELANASREELIRMLIKAEATKTPVTEKIDKKLEETAKASSVAESKIEAAKQAMKQATEQSSQPIEQVAAVVEEQPQTATRRRKAVKKQDATDASAKQPVIEQPAIEQAPVENVQQEPVQSPVQEEVAQIPVQDPIVQDQTAQVPFMNQPADPTQAPFPESNVDFQQNFDQSTQQVQQPMFPLFGDNSADSF